MIPLWGAKTFEAMEYKKSALLLGAEVFEFTKTVVGFPSSDNTVLVKVETSVDNFSELLKTELPFQMNGDFYEFEILFSAIIKLG